MRKIVKYGAGLLGSAALAGTLILGAAAPASAIERAQCASHNLNLISSSTTCWQNAGYASVALSGVYALNAGNNAGYVQGSGGTNYFTKYQTKSISYQSISGINIY